MPVAFSIYAMQKNKNSSFELDVGSSNDSTIRVADPLIPFFPFAFWKSTLMQMQKIKTV